jgi:transcriptional regulator of aromatic amino acid metabolism
VHPSQDNHDYMVKKFENGSTITYIKLPQINLKTFYLNVDKTKTKIKKKTHVKCFECSTLEHFSSECPPTRKITKQRWTSHKALYTRNQLFMATLTGKSC